MVTWRQVGDGWKDSLPDWSREIILLSPSFEEICIMGIGKKSTMNAHNALHGKADLERYKSENILAFC